MGMGRNLLRPKALVILFLTIIASTLYANPAFIKVEEKIQKRDNQDSLYLYSLPSRQTHMGPQIFFLEIPDNNEIAKESQSLTDNSRIKWLTNTIVRANQYRSLIVAQLEAYDLPYELLFLPIIESNYIANAVSRAGATGLWQLMRGSTKGSDIRIDEWVDERKDIWKSTQTALNILQNNYKYYQDWSLALAAYNCGMGRLNSIIKKSGIRDFWELKRKGLLPKETSRYVPLFYAITKMCSYQGRNNIPISWEKPLIWDRIKLSHAVDIEIIARSAKVPINILRTGNIELNYKVTPPSSYGYYLKTPVHYKEAIEQALKVPKHKLINFYLHTIRSGDTLYELSRHYGVNIDMIYQYNPGIKANCLQLGKKLIIPALLTAVKPPEQKNIFSGKPFNKIYIIKDGDTLWGIAQKHDISIEELMAKNGLNIYSIIQPGDNLKVPGKYY
jgi:membrane-bound lytic murein transglycosylase D